MYDAHLHPELVYWFMVSLLRRNPDENCYRLEQLRQQHWKTGNVTVLYDACLYSELELLVLGHML